MARQRHMNRSPAQNACRPLPLACTSQRLTPDTLAAVARKVEAGEAALAGGEPARALALAEAACQATLPPAEPAVRLRVEALLACGR